MLVELVVLTLVEVVDKCEVADIVVFQLFSETVGEDDDDAVALFVEV